MSIASNSPVESGVDTFCGFENFLSWKTSLDFLSKSDKEKNDEIESFTTDPQAHRT